MHRFKLSNLNILGRPRAKRAIGLTVQLLFGVAVCLLLLAPLVTVLSAPLGELTHVWTRVRALPEIGTTIWNTFLLSFAILVIALTVASLLAWCTTQLSGRAAGLAVLIVVAPFIIPPLAAVIGWIFLLSPRIGYLNVALRSFVFIGGRSGPLDVYSLPMIIIFTSMYMVPFAYVFLNAAMRGLDPSLEAAARLSGAGWLTTQTRIIIPMLRPAYIYGGAIVLVLGLGQFTAPLLLGSTHHVKVITTEVFQLTTTSPVDFNAACALAVPIMLAAVALILFQHYSLRKSYRYASVEKGSGMQRTRRNWAMIPMLVYALVSFVPPILGLALVALSPFWSRHLDFTRMSLRNFQELFQDSDVLNAAMNSLRFSLLAVLLSSVLAIAAGIYVARGSWKWLQRAVDYATLLPLSMPGIIFGLGVFLTFSVGVVRGYGSPWVFVLTYVILSLPYGVRAVGAGLMQIGNTPTAAARVAGAGAMRATVNILLPLLRPNVAGAAILMFILMTQEFAASSLLRTPTTEVISTQLYNRWEFGVYPEVAVLALMMVAFSMVCVTVIVLLGGRRALQSF
jgi:iron(III) transport system permease protein